MPDRGPDRDEIYEAGYSDGAARAWLTTLHTALRNLGDATPDYAKLAAERAEVVLLLREVCRDHGDNDWADNLNLRDIIDKHLVKYLDAPEAGS